ncbi:GntR family transcriptional regulator [Pseudonocardia asaccharolytica]|uniref:GntR family transcriptional regulator n=1 Tax=Pseudonocardia asaccharolytica DSM 44247 = NBRC 16224 TaxID=1123024 RepID=A0A511D1I7_9PSEU|nr:GntR family transcriptional regulator [Pseudonocardia asaccharolytica]GEL18662.1 GntR family transcriptional regulator [Pseudonocardia asaccharolytica DSM 44247 = NBRC 16224]
MAEARTTWRDIACDLRVAIARGDYVPGDRLPSRSRLTQRYGVAPQTVVNAINALRAEGLVVGVTGSGWYVRRYGPVMRMARTRLSRAERVAGRGAFHTDAHTGGWTARVEAEIRIEPACEEIAAALGLEPGAEVLVRDRVMFADDQAVQLATSSLPRDLTAGTLVEQEDTGPGGIYARLEEAGHVLTHFDETVRIGRATEHEADRLDVPVGAAVYRIRRITHTATRPVEINIITAVGERYELHYELPAE